MILAVACAAQSNPPAWTSTATYASGDQVQRNGNVFRATKAVPAGEDPTSAFTFRFPDRKSRY
jgi:hypothetical protein